MKITVHEWPLQAGQNQAKASVFDLNVPPLIMKWRDTTYQLIVDVFSLAHESQKSTGAHPSIPSICLFRILIRPRPEGKIFAPFFAIT